jgi:hypothetical protein
MNISIQKIEGYEVGHYLITGGPEPKIITKQMVLDSLRQLNS